MLNGCDISAKYDGTDGNEANHSALVDLRRTVLLMQDGIHDGCDKSVNYHGTDGNEANHNTLIDLCRTVLLMQDGEKYHRTGHVFIFWEEYFNSRVTPMDFPLATVKSKDYGIRRILISEMSSCKDA
ncbi:hypothetical protein AVEN_274078-1 [Araneus ventricosus]|uniref:Uncharacterized protein n=1 Tax=Araneus ventricosus TaxID=182803 RepID=A0A4Y2KG61_ARAVE|nr:hypothetical protein AVEN_274078-1 [Araneus ventricosus]